MVILQSCFGICMSLQMCTIANGQWINVTYFGINASEGRVIFIHFEVNFRGSDRKSPTSYDDRGNNLGRGAQNHRAYNTGNT